MLGKDTRGKRVKGAGTEFSFPARPDANPVSGAALSVFDLLWRDPKHV
ncbi:MAG: hypothetical protein OXU20_11335 [Myxococcales bacterium]|nr:hypothetical protein [Myxococcales bacterium]